MATTQPKLCAFDIETRGDNPEFVSGAVYSDQTQEFFTEPQRMLDCLRSHARKRYVLAAHHAEYDTSVLFWGQGEDVTLHYTNGQWTCGYWRYGSGDRRCPIWDSYRLAAGLELEKLGECIGIAKYPMPKKLVDPDDWRQDWICSVHDKPGCIECYNVRDAEIVWGYLNMLREWMDAYGQALKRSMPRMATELWRIFDPGQQQTPRSKELLEFGRRAYHGGRNEPFIYGATFRTYTYDIRSYYGSILSSIAVPNLSAMAYSSSVSGAALPLNGEGIVEATVFVDQQHCPPLPVNHNGRVYYPVGTFRGCWPISELRAALRYGCTIVRIHRLAHSRDILRPFGQTASVLLELRDDFVRRGDPRAIIPKFLINSIIGRLGLREVSERTTYRRWRKGVKTDELRNAEIESAGDAQYIVHRWPLARPARDTNVLWAACITGEGRQRLYRHLVGTGKQLVYCDTDSVHSLSPLQTGPDIAGVLRDTGTYDKGLYLAPKLYRLEAYDGSGEVRAKGIPRRYADTYVSTGGAVFQTTLGVVEAISRGISPSTWVTVERESHYAPGTRTILDTSAIGKPTQTSPTAPVVFTTQGSLGNMVTND